MLNSLHSSRADVRSPRRRTRARSTGAGFTLVELMVAVTGGLFVSIIVFSISKNSARFYQSETRVGEATLGGMVGFERLRSDIARAGFLSTANILTDPKVCGGGNVAGIPLLASLSSVQVAQNASQALNNTALQQDSILLSGSYSSSDHFDMRSFDQVSGGYAITLKPTSGAMTRLGYNPAAAVAARDALLSSVFLANRAVRIVDRSEKRYFGIVAGVSTQIPDQPTIQLAANPVIQQQGPGTLCGMDPCEGCVVNVVNFIRYDVASMATETQYAPLFADGGATPFDNTRMELQRVELDPTTQGVLAGTTPELVAQYTVDLKFGLVVDDRAAGAEPNLVALAPGNGQVAAWARPHRIRAVRVRFSVRTRDADREVDINQSTQTALGLPQGLYRVGLGPGGIGPFARVRTLQSDVMLNNVARFEEP